MNTLEIKQQLFETRDVIHDCHLNTRSFAEHSALNTFYEEWTDLIDLFLETYYGKYGRIIGEMSIKSSTETNVVDYLLQVSTFLNGDISSIFSPGIDSDLDNIVADMKGLINHTLYKLTLK